MLGIFMLFLLVVSFKELKSISYVGKSNTIVNTISVNGTGDAMATPDVATFSFSDTETAKTVTDAQTATTNKINAALKVVKDAGVDDKDVSTLSYNINPHYEYQNSVCPQVAADSSSVGGVMVPTIAYPCRPSKQVLTGYDVSETIQVKVRALDKAGAIFASIGALNVQNVNGLDFSVDKPDAVQAQARSAAIADAQTKAQVLAKQLGVSIVRVTSFEESNNQVYPIYAMGAVAMKSDTASAPAPQLPAGQQKVTDNVTITYEIQ